MTIASRIRALPQRLLSTSVRRIGRHPRLVQRLMACIRIVPTRRVRSTLPRTVAWPLAEFLPVQVAVSAAGGRMLVESQDLVGRVVAVSGEWEPHVTSAFRVLLSPGDVCVDVGAHVGYYTLLASKLVGPTGHVYAFEPVPTCLRALHGNVRRNDVTNVTIFDVAAGGREASAVMLLAPGPTPVTSSLSARMLASPHGGEAGDFAPMQVQVAAVDSLLPPETFERVRLVKIDVEGYEVEAPRGLERIFAAGAPLAVIVELSPDWRIADPAAFVDALCQKRGFVPWRLVNEYTREGYFPPRLVSPARLERIPSGRCDLLLARDGRRWGSEKLA
jgi:FkbM family methyltransferase